MRPLTGWLLVALALVGLLGAFAFGHEVERQLTVRAEHRLLVLEREQVWRDSVRVAEMLAAARVSFAEACRYAGFPDLRHCRRMADRLAR